MGGKDGVGARVVKIVVKELAQAEALTDTADELEAL